MTDRELDQSLKRVKVPARTDEYWAEFPGSVRREITWRNTCRQADSELISSGSARWIGWALAGAAALALMAFLWMARHPGNGFSERELAEYTRVWQELNALFPNQIRAVIFRPEGSELLLADQPNLPVEPALVVRGCSERDCTTALTRSGQEVILGGERFEILEDAAGNVLVTGDATVWPANSGTLQIRARVLEKTL